VTRAQFVAIGWLLSATAALAADPFARAVINDDGKIVPGQQVQLSVDVFAPDFFTSPPQFPLFDLPNAVVTLPDERAINSVQTIDGVQYSVIRRHYAIVPEISGAFTVPPIEIALGYSANGESVKGEARLAPIGFMVGEAPATYSNGPVFAARGLTLTQSFDRDPSTLKVGDAIVRTVNVFAEDTQAMMIPPVDVGQAHGLTQYQGPSSISDNVSQDRGTIGSVHSQRITYTAEGAGTFQIPAVSLSWFDIDAHRQEAATLPAATVSVAAAAASDDVIAPQLNPTATPERSRLVPALLAAALSLLAIVTVYRGSLRLLSWFSPRLRDWRLALSHSDRAEFRRLVNTMETGDDKEIYNALVSWSRINGYTSVSDWTRDTADKMLISQVGALEATLFGVKAGTPPYDRPSLIKAFRRLGPAACRTSRSCQAALPPLNPS
jgi:hypothetical protein